MKCSHCKKIGDNFIKYSSGIRGNVKYAYYHCAECNTNRAKNYRKTKKGKINIYRAVKKSSKNNPLKIKARAKVSWAIKNKKLIRPSKCQNCKKTIFVYGHHKDYNKPLDIIWLCRTCHANYHKNF